jgi:DNA-binding NarL/FixJ family response regulator
MRQAAIVIVDPLNLRRAGVAGFLRPWAGANQVDVLSRPPDLASEVLAPDRDIRLVVLNVGSGSLTDAEPAGWLRAVIQTFASAPVAVISDRDNPAEVIAAFRGGARGFLPTRTEPEIALQALSFIMAGGSFFPPAALLNRASQASSPLSPGSKPREAKARLRSSPLTVRQQAVLNSLREGKSNKVIARQLGMRESTVKVHVRQIMKKLGAANRTQAALSATLDLPPDLESPPYPEELIAVMASPLLFGQSPREGEKPKHPARQLNGANS